jgi:guanylate kinase
VDAGRLFVITGPSGVGKGTLIGRLLERCDGLELSISATTRPPRPGEQDGVQYHFLGEEEFDRMVAAGEFIEHATYAARRYGTPRAEVEPRLRRGTNVVLEIEVQGARQIRQTMPEAVQVFVAPPSPETLRERLVGRATDSEEEIERRLLVAEEELGARSEFGHVVVNDDLERATSELVALVRSSREADTHAAGHTREGG